MMEELIIQINSNLASLRYYAERKQADNTYRTILIISNSLSELMFYSHNDVLTFLEKIRKILIDAEMWEKMQHYYLINGYMPKKEVNNEVFNSRV